MKLGPVEKRKFGRDSLEVTEQRFESRLKPGQVTVELVKERRDICDVHVG